MTQHSEDTGAAHMPPTYEESVSPGSVAFHRPQPPADVDRAIAPLKLTNTNRGIKASYAVNISECKRGPDVDLHSTNGAHETTIYLLGTVPRAAEVIIGTTNGKVTASLPTRDEGQAIDVKTATTNGSINVFLPRDFDGVLTAKTTNGQVKPSPSVKTNSVIVPSGDSKTISYRIRPGHPSPHGPTVSVTGAPPPPGSSDGPLDDSSTFTRDVKAALPDTKSDTTISKAADADTKSRPDTTISKATDTEEQNKKAKGSGFKFELSIGSRETPAKMASPSEAGTAPSEALVPSAPTSPPNEVAVAGDDRDTGPDRWEARTTNGGINVKYYGDVDETCKKDSSCVIA